MEFDVTPEWASTAIVECANAVLKGAVTTERLIFEHGSGRWLQKQKAYFNCGCNPFSNTPAGPGDVGRLSRPHMQGLEQWFRSEYLKSELYGEVYPNVIKDGNEWNFAFATRECILSFHLQVAEQVLPVYTVSFGYFGGRPSKAFMQDFLKRCGYPNVEAISELVWKISTDEPVDAVYKNLMKCIDEMGPYGKGRNEGKLDAVGVE